MTWTLLHRYNSVHRSKLEFSIIKYSWTPIKRPPPIKRLSYQSHKTIVTIHPRRPWTRGFFSPLHAPLASLRGFKKSHRERDAIFVARMTNKPQLLSNCQWRKLLPATATRSNVGVQHKNNFLPRVNPVFYMENIFLGRKFRLFWKPTLLWVMVAGKYFLHWQFDFSGCASHKNSTVSCDEFFFKPKVCEVGWKNPCPRMPGMESSTCMIL